MPWNEVQIAKLRRRIEPKPFWRSEKKFRDGEGNVVIRGPVGHVTTPVSNGRERRSAERSGQVRLLVKNDARISRIREDHSTVIALGHGTSSPMAAVRRPRRSSQNVVDHVEHAHPKIAGHWGEPWRGLQSGLRIGKPLLPTHLHRGTAELEILQEALRLIGR